MSTNDPEFYQAPKFSQEQYKTAPHQRGCFFYGCIIASVLAVLMAILVGVLIFVAYRFTQKLIEDYTSTTPDQLPKVEMPDDKRQTLQDRVKAFRKAVEDGTAIEPLILSGDDVNALIDENAEAKGMIYVTIEKDELKGRISIPLDKLGLPMVKGRYLNGEADLKASLFDGELIVHIDAIEVNGKKPPEQIMTDLRKQNITKDFTKDAKNAAMLRKLESLEIKDGKIIVKVRAQPSSAGAPGTKTPTPVEAVPSGNGHPKTEPSKNAEPNPAAQPAPAQPATKKS